MNKAHFILRLATILILGLLIAGLIDRSDRQDLNLTEVEQAKLEAGEPVQVAGWHEDEFGHHAVYARVVGGEVVLYGVVKETE